MQLLRHLLTGEACQQALLAQCNAGLGAAPDIGQMRQLAAAMRTELAALKALEKAAGSAGADVPPSPSPEVAG